LRGGRGGVIVLRALRSKTAAPALLRTACIEIKWEKCRNFQSLPRFDGTGDASHYGVLRRFYAARFCQ